MNTRILFERDPGVELEWNCPKETMKVRVRDPEESRLKDNRAEYMEQEVPE